MTNFIVGRLKTTNAPFLKMNFDKKYDPRVDFSEFKVYSDRAKATAKLETLKTAK